MPENRIHSQFHPLALAEQETPAAGPQTGPTKHELQGLLRCPTCQSILIPKLCIGRNGKYHHYLYVCAGEGQECRTTRVARNVTVAAVESAVQTRLVHLRELAPSRERFVEEAIACVHWEVLRRIKAVELTRKRQARVREEIECCTGWAELPDDVSVDHDRAELEQLLDEHAELQANATTYLKEIEDLDALSESCQRLIQSWSDETETSAPRRSARCRRTCPI